MASEDANHSPEAEAFISFITGRTGGWGEISGKVRHDGALQLAPVEDIVLTAFSGPFKYGPSPLYEMRIFGESDLFFGVGYNGDHYWFRLDTEGECFYGEDELYIQLAMGRMAAIAHLEEQGLIDWGS